MVQTVIFAAEFLVQYQKKYPCALRDIFDELSKKEYPVICLVDNVAEFINTFDFMDFKLKSISIINKSPDQLISELDSGCFNYVFITDNGTSDYYLITTPHPIKEGTFKIKAKNPYQIFDYLRL